MGSLAVLLVLFAHASSGAGRAVFGHWRTADDEAIVSVERCGARLCGTITAVLDRGVPQTDLHNPDRARRQRPLVGLRVLSEFVGSGHRWSGGRSYDPASGRSYAARMMLTDDDRLAVTGCVLFLCRTQYWTRAAASGSR